MLIAFPTILNCACEGGTRLKAAASVPRELTCGSYTTWGKSPRAKATNSTELWRLWMGLKRQEKCDEDGYGYTHISIAQTYALCTNFKIGIWKWSTSDRNLSEWPRKPPGSHALGTDTQALVRPWYKLRGLLWDELSPTELFSAVLSEETRTKHSRLLLSCFLFFSPLRWPL